MDSAEEKQAVHQRNRQRIGRVAQSNGMKDLDWDMMTEAAVTVADCIDDKEQLAWILEILGLGRKR